MTMRSKQRYTKTRKRAKSFAKVSIGRLLRGLAGYQNHLSGRPVESTRSGGRRCVLCALAAWRETKEIRHDRERHCEGDCGRGFPRTYDAWTRLAGIGLRYGLGV